MGWRGYAVLRVVVVNCKSGTVFRGVLWGRRGGYLVLRNAELLQGKSTTPVDGEVAVPAANVDFLQVLA